MFLNLNSAARSRPLRLNVDAPELLDQSEQPLLRTPPVAFAKHVARDGEQRSLVRRNLAIDFLFLGPRGVTCPVILLLRDENEIAEAIDKLLERLRDV